jgi:hypothetical protein
MVALLVLVLCVPAMADPPVFSNPVVTPRLLRANQSIIQFSIDVFHVGSIQVSVGLWNNPTFSGGASSGASLNRAATANPDGSFTYTGSTNIGTNSGAPRTFYVRFWADDLALGGRAVFAAGSITQGAPACAPGVVTITPVSPLCVNGTAVTLSGNPVGGVFSGPGVTGSQFDPAAAGAGSHTITYAVTSPCVGSTTTTIVVNPLPAVSINPIGPLCSNSAPVTLVGSPAGGTFSGTGVTGNQFDPAAAGPGSHTISYSFTDGSGCSNSATTTLVVNPLPVVSIDAVAPLCVSAAAITLSGTPAGGTFSGPGVSGSSFDPATAGAGSHPISYSYTDGNGCSSSTTTTIVVHPLPTVTLNAAGPVCVDDEPITLVGSPAGGTFSGAGVTGNQFDPAMAGAGNHTVTYSFTDSNGCSNSATTTIVVEVCRDTTPPVITCPPSVGVTAGAGQCSAVLGAGEATATDDSGQVTVTGQRSDGLALDAPFPVGTTVVTWTATDAAGNSASCPQEVTVRYAGLAIEPPVNANGSSIFKLGRTVPVKLRLTGESAGTSCAIARLYLAQISNAVTGSEVEAESTAAATSGNLFRYDASADQYVFNLSTDSLSAGTWQLRIDLGDGVLYTVNLSLR